MHRSKAQAQCTDRADDPVARDHPLTDTHTSIGTSIARLCRHVGPVRVDLEETRWAIYRGAVTLNPMKHEVEPLNPIAGAKSFLLPQCLSHGMAESLGHQ